jgi:hypothetical protein
MNVLKKIFSMQTLFVIIYILGGFLGLCLIAALFFLYE